MNARLLIAVVVLVCAAFAQRYVERRRVECNLTWADPKKKEALEVGFLALGGFRGILADVLWMKALRQQDSARYYELRLLTDMIQRLQPTATHIYAFQAYNMSYNLARKAESCEDKWYWIRSGITTLEKGLARNQRNYQLWFELGFQYFNRLSDQQLGPCVYLRQAELPRFDDLSEEQRLAVFSNPDNWEKGRARPQEHFRFAAYYFWRALQTGTDPRPIIRERVYGLCLDHLGHWASSKPAGQRVNWDDWGSEDWWVEIRKRNHARGMDWDESVPNNLRFCLYEQMRFFVSKADESARKNDNTEAEIQRQKAQSAYVRLLTYFPEEKRSFEEILAWYHRELAKRARIQ
jgi:hypothetical protein